MTRNRQAEIEILNVMKKPPKTDSLRSVDMLVFDEMDKSSAEILTTFDIILCKIWNGNIYMGGVLMIFYTDHTYIHTIWGHTFLTSCYIKYCFKMATIENYVQDFND